MSGVSLRRQPHGIKVEQTTITISREEMTRLRREALVKKVSVSRHVVDLLRERWGEESEQGQAQAESVPA